LIYKVQDLNFLAFGILSPLISLSAPTFLPLLGQPDFFEQLQKKDSTNIMNAACMQKFLIVINRSFKVLFIVGRLKFMIL
jgi:hypothetical protein